MKKFIIVDVDLKETVNSKKGQVMFFDTEKQAQEYACSYFNQLDHEAQTSFAIVAIYVP